MVDFRIAHFEMLARYNRLANERLYGACAGLSEAELKRPRAAFFTSIHGTLNHILLGDRIWLARFEGGAAPSTGLDAILYEDFGELRAAREAEDARIETFATALTPEFLGGSIRYVNNAGRASDDTVDLLLPHLFNHQTHHRGQVTDLLMQTDVKPPVLDMHRVIKPDP
ncbi:MAG: DinB family protein [Alphaproteobacteria bacterium]